VNTKEQLQLGAARFRAIFTLLSESSEELNNGQEARRRATLRRSEPKPKAALRGSQRWVSYQPRNSGFSELQFRPG
ncbi:uncharacterized protein METZ01_LOCUS487641, partial [marine metagenome]